MTRITPQEYQDLIGRQQKPSKYHNVKVTLDNHVFDSKKEASRYITLKLVQEKGEIAELTLQPIFELQPAFDKGGKHYRKIEYVADFLYYTNGKKVVEDCKGMRTDVFLLKQKLFEYKYPSLTLRIV
jgi:hypothetical protein